MAYVLDANVFIQAKRLHYGLDFCPAFWDWLIAANQSGAIFSIEKVGDEIAAGGDDLSTWAAERGDGFFLKPGQEVVPALATVGAWVTGQQYDPLEVTAFLQVADYYLVGQALASGHTLVTHEKIALQAKRVKIPNVCIGLDIKCMTPFEMLRRERARFVLGPQP